MHSKATTVDDYLKELSKDRSDAISSVRNTILKYLPKGFEERMQYGMITYVVPISLYPDGYLGDKKTPLPFISLASQKNHMALYLTHVYADPEISDWFVKAYENSGKKLDMGKSCVRFSKLEDLPLEVIGETVAKISVDEFIALYAQSKKK